MFPYFRLVDKSNYSESDTNKYDEEAMKKMSYLLYPLLIIYIAYQIT